MRLTLALHLWVVFSFSQHTCGWNYAVEILKKNFSGMYREPEGNYALLPFFLSSNCYTVPVVFHILHLNGQENISDAQIADALRILNEDFRKLNADTSMIDPVFKPLAADACIQFSLASLDPDGKCTKGIVRHYDSLTYWLNIQPSNYKYSWPSDKYLNIYVVKQLPQGIGGYAYLPGTVGLSMDGIVILHSMVGSIGTSSPFSSRALTHEMGHALGLHHVWGGSNQPGISCGDDGVSDTPVTKGWSYCQLNNNDVCNPGMPENVQNYMEYSFCSNMFTLGQKNRMHQIIQNNIGLRGDLVSSQNLNATGVINPNYQCPPRPLFFAQPKETYQGGSVLLTDASDYDPPTQWLWKSDKSPNSYSQPTVNMVYHRSGWANIFFKCGNTYGFDSILKVNEIAVQSTVGGVVNQTYDFENQSGTDSIWFSSIPAMGSGFTITSQAAYSGQKSWWLPCYQDYPSEPVHFYFPSFNLNSISIPYLEFRYASTDMQTGCQSKLLVYGKYPGLSNWILLATLTGTQLQTAPVTFQNYFPSPADWKKAMVSLSPLQNQSLALLKFVFISDASGTSNNLFIDDIRVGEASSILEYEIKDENCKTASTAYGLHLSCLDVKGLNSLKITDIHGRTLRTIPINSLDFSEEIALPPGLYFLHLKKKSGASVMKIIHH